MDAQTKCATCALGPNTVTPAPSQRARQYCCVRNFHETYLTTIRCGRVHIHECILFFDRVPFSSNLIGTYLFYTSLTPQVTERSWRLETFPALRFIRSSVAHRLRTAHSCVAFSFRHIGLCVFLLLGSNAKCKFRKVCEWFWIGVRSGSI